MKKIALSTIGFYQKYISPRKGFRCSYGVIHDTYGCSGHVKDIIRTHGLIKGTPLIKKQFNQCKQASIELKKRKNDQHKKSKKCDPVVADCCVDPDCCDIFGFFN